MQNIKDALENQISLYLCDITNIFHYHTVTPWFLQYYSVTCRANLSNSSLCYAKDSQHEP